MKLVFEIQKEPVMLQALEVLANLGKNEEITITGKGDSIPDAVTVANILTNNLLKGNSKIHHTMVGSEPINEMGRMLSNISIILRKIGADKKIPDQKYPKIHNS